VTLAGDDGRSVGSRSAGPGTDRVISGSASFVVTTTGTTTFTGVFRRGAGGTCTFAATAIIAQVY